jgi:hypothetical protein
LPYEIYREELVAHNLPYGLRDNYTHFAVVTDPEGDTALKVTLRNDPSRRDQVWIGVVRGDEDGDAHAPMEDIISAIAALRRVAGLRTESLNPYLDPEGKEEAAQVVVRAAQALRTHPAHNAEEIATDLEGRMLQVIELASSRDFAATSVPQYVIEQRIREWQEGLARAKAATEEERAQEGFATPDFYEGLIQGGQSILNWMTGAKVQP